jgi:hypothetical protein
MPEVSTSSECLQHSLRCTRLMTADAVLGIVSTLQSQQAILSKVAKALEKRR